MWGVHQAQGALVPQLDGGVFNTNKCHKLWVVADNKRKLDRSTPTRIGDKSVTAKEKQDIPPRSNTAWVGFVCVDVSGFAVCGGRGV